MLSVRRGSGVRLVLRAHQEQSPRALVPLPDGFRGIDGPRWQELKRDIGERLLSQEYAPGELLPAAKELCAEFGTSHRTLRRALLALVREKRLERHRRTYRVAQGRKRRSHARLGFIATMDLHEFLDKLGPRSVSMWRALEQECRRNSLGLEIYDYRKSVGEFPWPDGARQRLVDRIDTAAFLGFMVWPYALRAAAVEEIVDMLAPSRKPVAVLCETWDSPLEEFAAAVSRSRDAQLFAVAQTGASGAAVGTHLVRLGHRRIAVFSPEPLAGGWSRRWEQLCAAYASAGVAPGPELFVCPEGFRQQDAETVRQLDRFEHATRVLLRTNTTSLTQSFVANRAGPYLSASRLALRMTPVFEQALRRGGYTAWVGMSDVCARAALHFLRARGVRVPAQVSVVGVDNDSEAFADGLTTYDFNMPAVVHAMVQHVLTHRRGPRSAGAPPYVELPGQVLVRQTSGPAPSPARAQTARG